jgi:hypothetical protein
MWICILPLILQGLRLDAHSEPSSELEYDPLELRYVEDLLFVEQ